MLMFDVKLTEAPYLYLHDFIYALLLMNRCTGPSNKAIDSIHV